MPQQRKARRRRKPRWDRIILAAALAVLLVVGVIAGIVALAKGGQKEQPESEPETSQSVSESLPEPEPEPTVDLSLWNLVLVNSENPLPQNFTVETGMLVNSLLVDARILEDLNAMTAAADAAGIRLIICSAYRDMAYQTNLYQNKVTEFINKGYTQQSAEDAAASIVAMPGTSEHNSGLAVDIVTPEYQVLDEGYAETDAAKWLAANAPEYGFILRYPRDKETVTGIIFEPWHFRYVGKEYARQITDSGLCFEEWVIEQTPKGIAR